VSEPIIFVVDPDAEALAGVETALQRRFGADYRIETDTNPSSAVGLSSRRARAARASRS
jgi:hypothetical protein